MRRHSRVLQHGGTTKTILQIQEVDPEDLVPVALTVPGDQVEVPGALTIQVGQVEVPEDPIAQVGQAEIPEPDRAGFDRLHRLAG